MNYKAALFDLDGVIFDTESQYTIFWSREARRYHPEIPDLEYRIKGQTLVQIFDGYFADVKEEQSQIVERLNEFERNMEFIYVEGVENYLRMLHEKDIHTAVVTSSNKAKMESLMKVHPEFAGLFDAILTSEDFEYSKPHPDCYLKAAKRFGLEPADCIVFEDSFNGLKSGRAAGMFVYGLATSNPADAIAPYCDQVINNFNDLQL